MVEHVERADDAADLLKLGRGQRLFGPPSDGCGGEIEFAVLEARHLREPRAERVEPHDMSVHLAKTQSQRVEILLKRAASRRESTAAAQSPRARCSAWRPGLLIPNSVRGLEAAVEHAGADDQRDRDDAEPCAAGVQADLAQMSSLLRQEDQLHAAPRLVALEFFDPAPRRTPACEPSIACFVKCQLGNPAILGETPVDRWLCVPLFRTVCPNEHPLACTITPDWLKFFASKRRRCSQ